MAGGQQRLERRLAAIFAADVAGYSRLMSQDEVGTLRALTARREVMDRLITKHGGRIANTAGDSVLAEFPSAVDAVQCPVEVQKALGSLNSGTSTEKTLHFRIGIHVGDVMVRGGDLLGDGVNIAARLESLADPGGICISGDVHRHVCKALPISFTDAGPQSPARDWLSGRGLADSKGLLKPDLEVPCGPQPLGGSIAAKGCDTKLISPVPSGL